MESGSKQLDWIHVRSSPVLRELQGIRYLRMQHLVSRMPCQPSCAFECMLGRGEHGTQRPFLGSTWEELAASSVANYLVDPASSHMLVSKIKPCMSKYKLLIL